MMSLTSGWRASCAAVLLLMLSACGRDALERPCELDAQCAPGFVCVASRCVDPSDPPPDVPPDTDTPLDMTDMDMEPPISCTSEADCPGGGQPIGIGASCAPYQCSDAGLCLPGEAQAVSCPAGSDQSGCGCAPRACQGAAQCDGLACIDGVCGPCSTSAECGGLVCDAGVCRPCGGDDDCAADQRCGDAGQCVTRPQCVLDRNCAAQEICLNGRCTFSPECTADADCREGFECIGDRCFEALCRGPEDCEDGQLCDAGRCIEQPQTIDRCIVATPNRTVSPGQRVVLEAFAYDAAGRGIAANFSWQSSDTSVITINASVPEAVAQQREGQSFVSAALAGAGAPIACEGVVTFTNLGPAPNPMSGALRVLVINAETSQPVTGAQVVVGAQSVTTLGNGVATLQVPQGRYEVSVFSQDHNYVTVQGASSRDIRIPLNPRTGTGPVGGFKGRFDLGALTSQGDVNIGLAGSSIAGGLINFSLAGLLGEPFVSSIAIPTQGSFDIPLPAGLVAYGRVFGFAVSLKVDYFAIGAGGPRLAWGLAGRVPSQELIALFQNGGVSGDFGQVLGLLLPLFSRFDHTVQPIIVQERPRVVDAMDFDRDGDRMELLPNYAAFPELALRPSVRQQLITAIDVSNFPTLTSGPGEIAIIVGGTLLQSPGFVPMGLTATTDQDGDGRPDVRLLTLAPPHGPMVGGRFALLAISFRTDGLNVGPGGQLELPEELGVALWNGQSLPHSIQLGTFPSASTVTLNAAARRLSVDAKAGPLYRARFVGVDRSWDVWSMGPAGTMGQFNHTITVPQVPNNRTDLFNNTKVLFDAIRTQVQLDSLLEPTGIYLHDVTLVSTGFNRTVVRP